MDLKVLSMYSKMKPYEIDNYIKDKIHRSGDINAKLSNVQRQWSEEELVMRNQAILCLMAEGYSRPMIVKELMARWEINKTTANKYLRQSVQSLVEDNEEFIKNARDIALARLENLMKDAYEAHDRKSFLSAMEQYNKINGLYTEKHEVKEDVSITFDFGKD